MNLFIAGSDFVCIFFLLVVMISVLLLRKREKRYVYYLISIIGLMFFCAADGVAYLMDGIGGNDVIHFYANLLSYTGVDIFLPAFVYYLYEKINESISFSKWHARVVLFLSFIEFWIFVYGSYTGLLFKIVDQKTVDGPMSNYVGITQLIISIYFLGQIYRKRKYLEKKLVNAIAFYFLLPIITIGLLLVNPVLGNSYVITSVMFLIVFVVVISEDLQAKTLSEKIMYHASVTDNLTGLLNRRAYADEESLYVDTYPKDFVYISLDVNGLKKVNDNIGHEAGDEIIVGASECMKRAFDSYGNVYRTGGDEFIAILKIPENIFDKVIENFEDEVANWKGRLVDSLTISFGYVKAHEAQGVSIHDVSVLADKRMYESKSTFYKKTGVDRRGQFEAHVALHNLYAKILKINITQDTYQIINMDSDEVTDSTSISHWLTEFGKSGHVHEEDLESYMEKTDITYLQNYFKQDKKIISIHYRRRFGDTYKQVIMEMIPTSNYSDDNQELFLYVKSIDK